MLGVALLRALPLGGVACEENRHRVEGRRREIGVPVLGSIVPRESEQLRTRGESLAKLLGKGRERRVVDAYRTEAVVREGDGDPACVGRRCADGRDRADLVDHSSQPPPAGVGILERQELVPRGQRRRARHQEMLQVVEVELAGRASSGLGADRCRRGGHCDSSSRSEKAWRMRRAFFTSCADTKGYSPYSRKLGWWWSRTNLTKAGAFVFQSSGNPSSFVKIVVMPVALNSAIASSVYLSKSVSKIPWYMKYVSPLMSNSTQR